jgi:esterase/lipase
VPYVHELTELTSLDSKGLPLVRQPIIKFSAHHNNTVSARDAGLTYSSIASEEKKYYGYKS